MSEDETKVVVLVADDEPSTLALVASHVRSKGYEVLEASDGDQAWQLAHEHLPDLVILDVMMPGMSGWEVCRKIREAVSLAHTGVIMLTGIGENLNEMTSPLYGADTYLDKPFEFSELDSRIDETLANRKDGAMGRPDASEPPSSTPRPGNGMAQPSLAKATLRSEPPPPYNDDEIDDDDDDSEDDLSDDDAASEESSDDAASASGDDGDDEEPATMPKPKLKSLAPKKASKSVIAKAASVVGPFLEKAAKILNRGVAPKKAAKGAPKKAAPKKAAPKKAAPKKAAPKKAAPKKAAKAAPKKAAKKAVPAKSAKTAKKAAPKKAPPKKAAKKAAPKAAKKASKKAAKAAPPKAVAKKAPAPKARPEAKKAPSKAKPKAGAARPTRPSPSGGDVTV
jgi:CheY-like chemotaxis protein